MGRVLKRKQCCWCGDLLTVKETCPPIGKRVPDLCRKCRKDMSIVSRFRSIRKMIE